MAARPLRTSSSSRNSLRAADLADAVQRLPHRDPADRGGDVVGRHRLDQRRREVDRAVDVLGAAPEVTDLVAEGETLTFQFGGDDRRLAELLRRLVEQ